MQIDLEKILVRANENLAVAASTGVREERVALFRRFLKVETARMRIRHRFGLGGVEISRGRSYLVDRIICHACQWAARTHASSVEAEWPCAIVALGGYGRRELAPFSDVDLLFLHAGRQLKEVKEFVGPVLYLLWDIGLTVGHSLRSVEQCETIAKEDLHSRNAMTEARFIIGNEQLFHRFTNAFEASVFRGQRATQAFLEAMRSELELRYEKFGRAVCLQEPNVKESAGGLRDLHTVVWVGRAAFGCRGLEELRAANHISSAEHGSASRAYDFIARVRNEAHLSTGRRTDLLTLELQPTVASQLGYKPKRGLLASELFMYNYYQRAHELHRFCESFLVRAAGSRTGKSRFGLRGKSKGKSGSFEIRQGMLYPSRDASRLAGDPMDLMEMFCLAQNERVRLSEELKITARSKLSLVDRRFRSSRRAGRAFIEILRQRGRVAGVLRFMHETGFLGRFLPEFGRITFLVQHDFYHKYTIDEHTLKAVEALDGVADGHDVKLSRLGKVFGEIEDAAPLYLGLLLHDLGKGRGSGHVRRGVRIAERVCERLSLDEARSQDVSFLIDHHLVMSHLSQRRDLTQENLISEFVRTAGTLNRLNMLMLLTYADTVGVGPGTWSEWKSALLWELYGRARLHLTGGKPIQWGPSRSMLLRQQVKEALAPNFPVSEIERHLAMLPERYLRATEPSRIEHQLQLVKLLDQETVVTGWRTVEEGHYTELTVCTRDKPGLFATIAIMLTVQGINILSADLYTREDSVVIDTFKICEVNSHHPVRAEHWPRVEQKLKAAVDGLFDVASAIEQWQAEAPRRSRRHGGHTRSAPSVRFDVEASSTSTVIEVKAEDEPGLAYKIASTLTGLDLNITFAKITTDKRHALDVFYVTDARGERLTSDDMRRVERTLLQALDGKEAT